ncbi:Sensor histidine kinase YehU [compost metagenome]
MRRGWYAFSIKTNMTIAFMSVSLISILILNMFTNYYYNESVKKDFLMISSEAQSRLNNHMDDYFKYVVSSTSTLLKSDLTQLWLSRTSELPTMDIDNIEIELRRYVALNFPEILGMFLMDKDQQIIAMNGENYIGSKKYNNEPWYDLPLNEKLVILPTHLTLYPQNSGIPVLSLLIPIYNTNSLELKGRLVIDISLSKIQGILGTSKLGKTGLFFLVTEDTIVYHPNRELLGLKLNQTELGKLTFDSEETTSIQHWQKDKVLVAVNRSTITDWRIVSLVPYDEMASGLEAAKYATYVAILFLGGLIVAAVNMVSGIFVKPLLRLKQLMQSVARGDLNVRANQESWQLEFQQLEYGFNRMVEQLNELLGTVYELRLQEMNIRLRQKEALIQSLQNQINPHLLYNSLDIIKSIAYLEEVPRVEKIAKNLADVYRYTARFADNEVTLDEELIHLEKYLEIVHLRFPHNFQGLLTINDKYRKCLIEKLTLQPIVENAVKYGIEARGGSGAIIVSAYEDQEDLIIEIADNGPGISASRLADIQARLDYITNHVKDHYISQDSLGLANVHARLVLKFGERYGVSLSPLLSKGMVVTIRVPYLIRKNG